MIKLLLAQRHDVDVNGKTGDGMTVLMLAVEHGNKAVAKLLPEAGAEVDDMDN